MAYTEIEVTIRDTRDIKLIGKPANIKELKVNPYYNPESILAPIEIQYLDSTRARFLTETITPFLMLCSNLRYLILRNTAVTAEIAILILKALPTMLELLDLENTLLKGSFFKELNKELANGKCQACTTLQTLNLRNNFFRDEDMPEAIKLVHKLPKLQKLQLDNPPPAYNALTLKAALLFSKAGFKNIHPDLKISIAIKP